MLTGNQLEKFAREFFKTVKDISPSIRIINEHLNTEGIDKFQIFKDVIGDFFIGFLPFPVIYHDNLDSPTSFHHISQRRSQNVLSFLLFNPQSHRHSHSGFQ